MSESRPRQGDSPSRIRRTPLRAEVADARACTLESRRRILGQLPFFRMLEPREVASIGDEFWERGFRPGEGIYRPGEPASHLYVLATGKVRLDRPAAPRPGVLLDVLGPGDFFGTLPALGSPTYVDAATALTAGCALVVDREAFDTVLERHPPVALAALRAVGAQLEAARAEIARLGTLPLDQRVAAALVRLASRFGERRDGGLLIQVPLTRQDLGAMTGATLESVSRVMSRFRRAGLVRSGRGWIAVRDPERLGAIAGQPIR